eukprot:CAMPEP_0194755602 /NCGR_PEP_ID=MMETSP0323_2-20130528/9451_1 /TAXON_ID=2866 ORGANISM="Crypthecodinium cohnii, Strain Seligo" /NCGR_SAMPLE_ID=MMETSP0323_2 /ASSEMBLY_ACC=CAM_ASM_000346 /LENGTH=171 /DNA_ID=CAMNT_0039674733 /DNA_START=188 /DNA_END=704 /DNA_ORIENTATION=-
MRVNEFDHDLCKDTGCKVESRDDPGGKAVGGFREEVPDKFCSTRHVRPIPVLAVVVQIATCPAEEHFGNSSHLTFVGPPLSGNREETGSESQPWMEAQTPIDLSIDSYNQPSELLPPCEGMTVSLRSYSWRIDVLDAIRASLSSWNRFPVIYPSSGEAKTGAAARNVPGSS